MSGKFSYIWENDKLRTKLNILAIENKKLLSQCDELKAKLEKAEKALIFYSIPMNYGYNRDCDDHVEWIDDKTHQRMGRKAQQALKEIRGEG